MKRWILLLLGLPLVAAAQPGPMDQAKAHLLPGWSLVTVARVPLRAQNDVVVVTQKNQTTRAFVLPAGSKAPLWLTLRNKKQDLPAPVQGGSGESMTELLFSCDLDHNRKPYLFVTCYMADVYCLLVFRPDSNGYSEVFRASTNGKFSIDHKTGRISEPAGDDSPARTFNWVKGHYK